MIRNAAIVTLLVTILLAVTSCSENDNVSLEDREAPTTSIVRPWDDTDRFGVVDVVVSANDNVGVTRVDVYANGDLVGSDTTSPYVVEWDMSGYADGSVNTLYAVAHDAKGNSAQTDVLNITKNQTAFPNATMTSPADGAAFAQGDVVVLAGSATDAEDGTISAGNIVWYSNLQGEIEQGDNLEFRGLVIGEHKLSMIAYDSNAMADTVTVVVDITANDLDYAVVESGTYTIASPTLAPSVVVLTEPYQVMKKELTVREAVEALLYFYGDAGDALDVLEDLNEIMNQAYQLDTGVAPFGRGKILASPVLLYSFTSDPDEKNLDLDDMLYPDYPALFLNYFQACMICNAISDQDNTQTLPYRILDANGADAGASADNANMRRLQSLEYVNGSDGWRMPTEAEWEVAARAGYVGKKFPWGDEGPGALANSLSDPAPADVLEFMNGRGPVPVDSYQVNRYGLYNMVGNAAELTSDMFSGTIPSGTNPIGVSTASFDKLRYLAKGGSWHEYGPNIQIGMRFLTINLNTGNKASVNSGIGIRLVRTIAGN